MRGSGAFPPRGSFAEQVLVEMLARERQERVARWRLDVTLQAVLAGLASESVQKLIDTLRPEFESYVYHTAYDIDVQRQRLLFAAMKLQADEERMRRVAALG